MSSDLCASDVRIGELILLESMFPKQLLCYDLLIETAIKQQNYDLVYDKQIECSFSVDKQLELIIQLDREYPKQLARVHCRVLDGTLPNAVQKSLNDSIVKFIDNCVKNEFICDVITVIQKATELWTDRDTKSLADTQCTSGIESNDLTNVDENNVTTAVSSKPTITRYWIYSHHIKSTKKRQMIVDLAQELHLNGFTCVGKPGFICVEGNGSRCEEFWTAIRATQWQRITLIESEDNLQEMSFNDFHELTDNSNLFRLLEAKNCETIVKNFLGLRSSATTTPMNANP